MSDYKKTNDLTAKTALIDTDLLRIDDSADEFAWKKATIANVSTKVQADIIADDNTFTGTNVFPTINIGTGNTVSGDNATAEGSGTTASGGNSHSEGYYTIASGLVSHAEGYYSTASGENSHAEGSWSEARLKSQHAQAGGKFAVNGDAQNTKIVAHKETTDATPIECITENAQRYVIPSGFIMACTVSINGSNADGSVAGFYKRQALIKNIAGTTALIDTVQTIGTDIEMGTIGGIAITADDTNDSLLVTITGKADETIRWVCVIDALEVGH